MKLSNFFESQRATELICANSMYAAVDLMLEHDFSMFVVDGQLLYAQDRDRARVAGPDFVRFIRMCEGAVSEVPVIFLRTENGHQNLFEANAEIEQARDAGANGILPQPFDADRFDATVRPILLAPRPFVRSQGYVGPCRRVKDIAVRLERRKSP